MAGAYVTTVGRPAIDPEAALRLMLAGLRQTSLIAVPSSACFIGQLERDGAGVTHHAGTDFDQLEL